MFGRVEIARLDTVDHRGVLFDQIRYRVGVPQAETSGAIEMRSGRFHRRPGYRVPTG
ncbi:hypothetical protein GCM10007304_48140 [Rhodococcoides trifolii]|uniref:Uncharacterized protein n=1 Tax=Rhodococcoides trifolii TaxID=908250 RepID=A0A917G8N3_9NOCA|nr:hypothetical protein GCM10007304_48140 [Rhodococcus trifolii]